MQEKSFDEMNVMPLVDVMLVLLTIVLMTASFIQTGSLPLQLPKAEKGTQGQQQTQTQVVEVDHLGVIHFQGHNLSLSELFTKLTPAKAQDKILLRIDANAKVQDFVKVYHGLQNGKYNNIHLQIQK